MSDLMESAAPETSQPQDQGQAQPVSQPESAPASSETASPQWYLADNLPGEGERPEWLKEKYKTAADQAKAYTELEKRLGAFKGAPDEYNLEIDDPELQGVKFDKENPVLQDFLKTAKEQGVSQEFVETMLKNYAKMEKMKAPNLDKEMEKLGPNAKQDLQLLFQWGSNNLSRDELATFKSMVQTAEQVRLFEKMRRIATKAETQPTNTRTAYESPEKIKRMIHDPRYETDPVFRDEVRAKLAQILPE